MSFINFFANNCSSLHTCYETELFGIKCIAFSMCAFCSSFDKCHKIIKRVKAGQVVPLTYVAQAETNTQNFVLVSIYCTPYRIQFVTKIQKIRRFTPFCSYPFLFVFVSYVLNICAMKSRASKKYVRFIFLTFFAIALCVNSFEDEWHFFEILVLHKTRSKILRFLSICVDTNIVCISVFCVFVYRSNFLRYVFSKHKTSKK